MVSKNENEIVKYYKELAEAQSTEDNIIEPLFLIQKELDSLEEVLEKKTDNNTFLKKENLA